jgi:hypothetical protein
MRRRRPVDVSSGHSGGWWLNGVRYPSEEKYLARVAFDERCGARRVRLMAKLEIEDEK